MAVNFYWNQKGNQGSLVVMDLTIVGEVRDLFVTATGIAPTMPVRLPIPQTFQPCVPFQVVEFAPVPVSFLPLNASGTDCVLGSLVVSPASLSPGDPTGPGPFCDALTAGGPFLTTPGGGGTPTTPQDKCNAAQHSPLLDSARTLYTTACEMYRTDQANVTLYTGIAAAMWAVAGGLWAGAATAANPWVAGALAITAFVVMVAAEIVSYVAAQASLNISRDLGLMDTAQKLWENAIASVKTACCPAWISISTADLTCP